MADLRTEALRALDNLRFQGRLARAEPGDLDQISALAHAMTPTTRMVLQSSDSLSGYALKLESLAPGAVAPTATLEAMLRVIGDNAEFRSALMASGECRVDTPYAPIRPILQSSGSFRWCCTHKSGPHCST
jgi:hypothetical protein